MTAILKGQPYAVGTFPTALRKYLNSAKEYQVSQPSVELLEFLTRHKLPWLEYIEQKQKLVMVVDNHLMQMYRACPQHFVFSALLGQQPKSPTREDDVQRVWYLDFGILLHKMIELYYKDFRKPGFEPQKWAIERATAEWYEMKMDVHSEHKEYKSIGGLPGFIGLLFQFAFTFTPENEKLRIIGQEVSFGKRGEVPLYIGDNIEIYLAGRMDLIVDDGYFICPMDHKSKSHFSGDPGLQYETEEGPTGYVYALSKILPQIVPADQILKRDCSKILMNLISKKTTSTPAERFKRVPIRKTTEQLVEYRLRMVRTGMHLYEDMESLARSLPVYRNTNACTDWFHGTCNYKDVCRQSSRDAAAATLRNGFVQVKLWDTEAVKPTT
jgi:hypothetical protein